VTHPGSVWITGVGTATPLGNSYSEFAKGLVAGRSGVRRVVGFDASEHPSQIAGQLTAVPCPPSASPAEFAGFCPTEKLIRWCCEQALRDSGWWERRHQARIGLVLGCGAEWLLMWEADSLAGGRNLYHPELDVESVLARTRRALELRGPVASVSAACASGNVALSQARHWLELGWVDVCLAGACDMAVTPMALAGFGNLRALSRRNAEPEAASRPFDRDRDGFVMGEGGAVFVLESEAMARRRSARAYAALAGYGASSDAYNMVIPSPNPVPATEAVRAALADACVNPHEVDYVNAHATSTLVGDAAEARVLAAVFGDAVRRVPVSSTKSMMGHLLTAAAAVEALACLVAMDKGALPPTINLHKPDPDCALCHVANEARPAKVRVAISNSFGFGGSNTSLVLRAA
jgi:3-oxoacyl-[acyl-carrier-protein] synthase II